jgi:hypothetical protein
MFDEPTNTGGGQPPQNLPIEPDDMFSGVDATAPSEPATPGVESESAMGKMVENDALSAGVLPP